MYLHISSSLSLSNHPWISQNENCNLDNSSLPLIRAFGDPLISPFRSPQHKYGFLSKHLTSLVTEYLLVLWGVSLPQGGQSTTIVFWPGGHFTTGVKILRHQCAPQSLASPTPCLCIISRLYVYWIGRVWVVRRPFLFSWKDDCLCPTSYILFYCN